MQKLKYLPVISNAQAEAIAILLSQVVKENALTSQDIKIRTNIVKELQRKVNLIIPGKIILFF